MIQHKYIQAFFYSSAICGILILVFFLQLKLGFPSENTSDWFVTRPNLGTSITKKITSAFFSCLYHADASHLLGNVISFLLFGTYMFYISKKYSYYALAAGMILPGFFLYFLPHQENISYIGFSGVCFTAIGFSLVSFLRTDFELKSDWLPAIIVVKLLAVIFLLNSSILGKGFWSTLYQSENSGGVAWQIHLVGLIIGISFGVSDKENAWHFLFGNKITSKEKESLQQHLNEIRNAEQSLPENHS